MIRTIYVKSVSFIESYAIDAPGSYLIQEGIMSVYSKCSVCGRVKVNCNNDRGYICSECKALNKKFKETKECLYCKRDFIVKRITQKFCSNECRDRAHKAIYNNKSAHYDKVCKSCNKKFHTVKQNKLYCCKLCYNEAKVKRGKSNYILKKEYNTQQRTDSFEIK